MGNKPSGASKKVSLKAMTLDNNKQKVNDELGNPIEIGTIVIWQVVDPSKPGSNVQNYKTFLSIQCDLLSAMLPDGSPMIPAMAAMKNLDRKQPGSGGYYES